MDCTHSELPSPKIPIICSFLPNVTESVYLDPMEVPQVIMYYSFSPKNSIPKTFSSFENMEIFLIDWSKIYEFVDASSPRGHFNCFLSSNSKLNCIASKKYF